MAGRLAKDRAGAPVTYKGKLVQYAGRILRPYDGKTTAEVHDYVDKRTGVLASSLAKRAPGYVGLGFPDPRRLPYAHRDPRWAAPSLTRSQTRKSRTLRSFGPDPAGRSEVRILFVFDPWRDQLHQVGP